MSLEQPEFERADFLSDEEVKLFNEMKDLKQKHEEIASREYIIGSLLHSTIVRRLNLYNKEMFIDEESCSVMIRK